MKITSKYLYNLGACQKHIDLFDAIFPDGAELTVDNWITAKTSGLDVVWLAGKLPKNDDVRKVVCTFPETAYEYAINIDRRSRDDTRIATSLNGNWFLSYIRDIDDIQLSKGETMAITITMSILSACMFAISVLCYIHDRSAALMSARIYRALARAREEEQRA